MENIVNEAVIPVRMTEPMLGEALQQAERSGMSVEQWLISVAAERIRDEQVAARFFSRTPQHEDGQSLMDLLAKTRDNPPGPDDELR
jgi:hypothetical protein